MFGRNNQNITLQLFNRERRGQNPNGELEIAAYQIILRELNVPESICKPIALLFWNKKELLLGDIVDLLCSINTPPNIEELCTKIAAEILKVNRTILKVELQATIPTPGGWTRIYIEDIGAEYIAEMIKHNTSLQELNLSTNNITDVGAKHISEALKYNRNLKKLDISFNEISPTGFKHIAEMLEINRTLKTVDLSSQNPAREGTRHLIRALNTNPDIASLRLFQSSMPDDALKELVDSFNDKPMSYFSKHTAMLSGIKLTDSPYGVKVDKLTLIQKLEFWNRKISGLNKYIFTPEQFTNPKIFNPTPEDMALDALSQDINFSQNNDLQYALHAYLNIKRNHLKKDFLKYLSKNDDAYSQAVLGIYYGSIGDEDNAQKHLSISIERDPEAVNLLKLQVQLYPDDIAIIEMFQSSLASHWRFQ